VSQEITHISGLRADPRNARSHNPKNIGMLVDSLHEVGAARSIVIDEDNVVLAGNGVIEAAGEAGIENVRVVEADGDTIIAVRRTGLTERQKTRLALYDNRAGDLSAFDVAALSDLVAGEGDILRGLWRPDELDEMLRGLPDPDADDDAPPGGAGTPGTAADGADLPRVAPDQETAQAGLFLHLRSDGVEWKIPMTEVERDALRAALDAYRARVGTYYGLVNHLLGGGDTLPLEGEGDADA
jgi:hypothetical protein